MRPGPLFIGQRFGRLTVRSWRGWRQEDGERTSRMVLCVCDCGTAREVQAVLLRMTRCPIRNCGGAHLCLHCGRSFKPAGESQHRRFCVVAERARRTA